MFDGQETVTLAPNVQVADDDGVVSQVIIKITNPVHNMDESLSVTLSGSTSVELVSGEIMLIVFYVVVIRCKNTIVIIIL